MARKNQLELFNDCAVELSAQERKAVEYAVNILDRALRKHGAALNSPERVADYLKLHLAAKPHEVFVALFLDVQNQLIEAKEMFRGTLTQTAVYPREVVKEALNLNAAAVIFAHNHPSGVAEPSRADELLTANLKQALAMVDVKVLDHFVIARTAHMSFAQRGLIL